MFLLLLFFSRKEAGGLVPAGRHRRRDPVLCPGHPGQLFRRRRLPGQPLFFKCLPPVLLPRATATGRFRFSLLAGLSPPCCSWRRCTWTACSTPPRRASRHFLPGQVLSRRKKRQYSTLPSNTNPRAFNKQIADQYTLFFLNDNFHPHGGRILLDLCRPGAGAVPAGAAGGQDLSMSS
ncbi:MAG: hypothetical protein MZV64_28800 [Ignavibacteriales bacterium]|nr:hypothetical protein [Ignavibacteriales bacterium]